MFRDCAAGSAEKHSNQIFRVHITNRWKRDIGVQECSYLTQAAVQRDKLFLLLFILCMFCNSYFHCTVCR